MSNAQERPIEEKILKFLDEKNIKYEVFEHKPVYTCEKMAKYLKTAQNFIAKSMILKKSEDGFLLAVLPGSLKIDYNKLAHAAKTKSLSLAPIEEAEKLSGCSVGCVYPLGNLINLETYIDKKLLRYDMVYFNPGSHVKSVKINSKDLVSLTKPVIADFTKTPAH